MVQKALQMEKPQKKTGSLIFLVLSLVFSAWGTPLFAQKSMVTLSVDDATVAPNRPVTFTVTTNLSGTIKVDYPLELALDYGLMNGMEQKMDPSTGKISTHYYIRQSGYFRKKGTYTFRAYVRYQGRNIPSNQITVKVSEDEVDEDHLGFNSKEPIFGVIEARKTSVYEGEPLLLKAKVYSKLDIFFLEGYSPFKADKNPERHVFQNERYEVGTQRYKGQNVLTFEYGKQLLFPVSTGKCRIQPFEMSLKCRGTLFDKTVTFRSSSAVITIKPLPSGAPKDFIGAVGTYSLSQKLGKTTLKQGDVFTLTLVVNGLGNLHNSNAPILDLPAGCAIYGDPERKEDFVFTEEGVEGSITYIYNIQVMERGKIQFPAPSISWFDPAAGTYITSSAEPFTLDVEYNSAFKPIGDSIGPPAKSYTDSAGAALDRKGKETARRKTLLVVGIVSPICLLGGLLFFFMRRKKENRTLEKVDRQGGPVVKTAPPAPARDYWKEAVDALQDPEAFSILLPKAIVQRIEKKYGEPPITRDRAMALLAAKYDQQARELREVIGMCDQFRYGFGDQKLETQSLLERAARITDSL